MCSADLHVPLRGECGLARCFKKVFGILCGHVTRIGDEILTDEKAPHGPDNASGQTAEPDPATIETHMFLRTRVDEAEAVYTFASRESGVPSCELRFTSRKIFNRERAENAEKIMMSSRAGRQPREGPYERLSFSCRGGI